MEIAIMGAGLSGLSCAIALEKQGLKPTIFEKRSCVGDRFINAEAMFSILDRPISDSLYYVSNKHSINLKPISKVNRLFLHSKNELGSINGPIGYTNIRGRHENSFECQLEKQVKSKINFNSNYTYESLCKEFEYIVLATGDGDYAARLGNYRCDVACTIKGATVEGEFTTDISHVWFNYDIIPKGYAWAIPFSEKEANIVIAYPNYPEIIKLDINDMWNKFYNTVCKDLDQNLRITDRFEITKYIMGICNRPRIENTYFIGNCFGAISPGFGFGQFASILTGIYSAYDLCKIDKYEELVKPLFENYDHSLTLRRFLETLDDRKLDSMVRNLDNKLIDKLIDKVSSDENRLELLGGLTPFMKLWNNYKMDN